MKAAGVNSFGKLRCLLAVAVLFQPAPVLAQGQGLSQSREFVPARQFVGSLSVRDRINMVYGLGYDFSAAYRCSAWITTTGRVRQVRCYGTDAAHTAIAQEIAKAALGARFTAARVDGVRVRALAQFSARVERLNGQSNVATWPHHGFGSTNVSGGFVAAQMHSCPDTGFDACDRASGFFVKLRVGADGSADVMPVEEEDACYRDVVKTVRQCGFIPAMEDGVPVASDMAFLFSDWRGIGGLQPGNRNWRDFKLVKPPFRAEAPGLYEPLLRPASLRKTSVSLPRKAREVLGPNAQSVQLRCSAAVNLLGQIESNWCLAERDGDDQYVAAVQAALPRLRLEAATLNNSPVFSRVAYTAKFAPSSGARKFAIWLHHGEEASDGDTSYVAPQIVAVRSLSSWQPQCGQERTLARAAVDEFGIVDSWRAETGQDCGEYAANMTLPGRVTPPQHSGVPMEGVVRVANVLPGARVVNIREPMDLAAFYRKRRPLGAFASVYDYEIDWRSER